MLVGQLVSDFIGHRVEVAPDEYVHNHSAIAGQPVSDRMARGGIKLFLETESRPSNINRDAVEAAWLGNKVSPEIFRHARNFSWHSKIVASNLKADRIVIDDGYGLAGTCQHCCEVASAATENEHIFRLAQKRFHNLHVIKLGFSGLRAMALKDIALEVKAMPVRLVFPNCYVAKHPFEASDYFHLLKITIDA